MQFIFSILGKYYRYTTEKKKDVCPMKQKTGVFSTEKHSPLFFLLLFAIGAVGYFGIEILFRGFSHWSMALCGGVCLCFIYLANQKISPRSIFFRAIAGAAIITTVEFVAGCILNLYLHWDIWNYSHLPLNLWGQISPVFSILWFLLCIPVCFFCSLIDRMLRRHRMRAQREK